MASSRSTPGRYFLENDDCLIEDTERRKPGEASRSADEISRYTGAKSVRMLLPLGKTPMKHRAALFFTVTVLAAGLTLPAWAEAPSVPAQPALDQAIEQYIRSHPEVIEQAMQSLEGKRQRGEKLRIRQAIATHQEELLRDPASPVSGNVNGDVTVIEFFDYRCGYCKRVASAVTQLQKDEPGVRVVYKDFPILGEVSVFGARAALAARGQGKHQAFHEAMLASENELTQEEVLAIAQRVGLDVKKLESDLQAPEWQTAIDRNHTLAKLLGISGTPGFVVGGEVYPGALELADLKALVAKARTKR